MIRSVMVKPTIYYIVIPDSNGHLLLETLSLSHVELLGNAPVRPGYNELSLQLATAACHAQRPNRNSLTKTSIRLHIYSDACSLYFDKLAC
jgi:hypothetical protein